MREVKVEREVERRGMSEGNDKEEVEVGREIRRERERRRTFR